MFDNIGSKIKMVAKISCWIGIVAYVILGILLLSENSNELWGFTALIAGPIFSWLSSFITYGFGQLVENSDRLVEYNTIKTAQPQTHGNEQKIQQLKLLQEKGLITDDEFNNKINELHGEKDE